MSKRSSKLLLEAILEAISNVISYTQGMDLEAFIFDGKTNSRKPPGKTLGDALTEREGRTRGSVGRVE